MAVEQHLDPDTLAAYVDGRLELDELSTADRHIDACGSCRSELSALAAVHTIPVGPERPRVIDPSSPASEPGSEVPEGKLGRYHVLRELGRGSMGVVLRAYDPELARPVAIKFLRDVRRDELREEARALARLRHPNVVTVYDVFTDEHGMYLAMELVDGDTLRGFAKGRTREQILDACVRAGRGLAAAHDAGVIHRDFKPENVLCDGSREVRVSDFGLARSADALDGPDCAVAGTPAYMAPEILRREPATEKSDQYSYCVTVHEMLSGKRSADVDDALSPPWVARALRRGLARDPADRFPSMHALIAALSDDPRARRRRRLLVASVAAAALATGALVVGVAQSSGPTCAIDERALGDAWSAQRAADITRRLTAMGSPDANLVVTALDRYAREWVDVRRDACAATHERGEQSQQALDRRVACLDRIRREIREVGLLLADADTTLAANAPEVVVQIRNPLDCTGADVDAPADPASRVVFEQARTLLDRANALQFAARLDAAERMAAHAESVLANRDIPRVLAEALLIQARVNMDRDKHERAEELLYQALHAAERGHDDRLVAEIWIEIVMATGVQRHRFDLAVSNARAADAAVARVDSLDLQLRYAYAFGGLMLAQGKLDEARAPLERGVKLAGDDPRRIGQLGLVHATLCDVERQAGKLPAAREHCTKALGLLEQAFGSEHLRVALTRNVLGALAFGEHDLAAAEREYKKVIEILEKRNLRTQITYALALSNLGAVYSQRDDVATSRAYFERALAAFDANHPKHPQRLMPLQGLASLALRTGDTAGARDRYAQVRDAMTNVYGPDHPQTLIATYNLALAYQGNKQPAEAAAALAELVDHATRKQQWMLASRAYDLQATLADERNDERAAIALIDKALAAIEKANDPVERALVLRHQGEVYRHMKKPALAIAPLERALADFGKEPDAYDIGATRYHLALALFDSGRNKARAVEIAKQAAADLARAQTGEGLKQYRETLAAFIAKH